MKLFKTTSVILALAGIPAMVAGRLLGSTKKCDNIQSGKLKDVNGVTLVTGYDSWGYNYQAHIFNGKYCDYDRKAGCIGQEGYEDVDLIMKWNDAWLSNKDCNGDTYLDRPNPYIGSGAWLTNHESGEYEGDSGETCQYTYFVKIIAVPSDWYEEGGVWYDSDGNEIGQAIWGSFAIIQEVWNDPCNGEHGVYSKAPRPGLGNWEDEDGFDDRMRGWEAMQLMVGLCVSWM